MPGSNFRTHKPLKLDKKICKYLCKSIVYQYFGFSSTVRFEKARNATIFIQESDFEAKKSSKVDKKRISNIYVNHPRSIINQYFGFSSIVWFVRARNHHF